MRSSTTLRFAKRSRVKSLLVDATASPKSNYQKPQECGQNAKPNAWLQLWSIQACTLWEISMRFGLKLGR